MLSPVLDDDQTLYKRTIYLLYGAVHGPRCKTLPGTSPALPDTQAGPEE